MPTLTDDELHDLLARAISAGKIVGMWAMPARRRVKMTWRKRVCILLGACDAPARRVANGIPIFVMQEYSTTDFFFDVDQPKDQP